MYQSPRRCGTPENRSIMQMSPRPGSLAGSVGICTLTLKIGSSSVPRPLYTSGRATPPAPPCCMLQVLSEARSNVPLGRSTLAVHIAITEALAIFPTYLCISRLGRGDGDGLAYAVIQRSV